MFAKLKLLILTVGVSIAITWLSVEGWALKEFLTKPIANQAQAQVIQIPKGASSKEVAQRLYEAQMIRHPTWFVWWLRYHGLAQKLQAGEFEIQPHWTLEELADHLISGAVVHYPMTLIAGETLAQTLKKVNDLPKLKGQVTLEHLAKALDTTPTFAALEGRFLPETYHYTAGEERLTVLLRAHQALQKVLAQAWQQRQADLPLLSEESALILASIVEKETGYAPERAMIAGVFVNRLKRKMRLQSDPTVIYGMGDAYQGNIRKKDLLTKTPYNTYRMNGLPPTPIALPSREAIEAVCQPAKTKALYFVAKGQAGQHVFNETLEAHNRAVRHYLLKR